MAAANAAKKKAVEEIIDDISDLTPQTAYTPLIHQYHQLHCHLIAVLLKEVVIRSVDRLWKSSWKET
jgi:hypothetical protein